LLAFAALALLISVNLRRTRTGRAWRALRERDVVAAALGINVTRFKLLAFVISAAMTATAGALFAYFRNFVSIDAFSLYLTVQYVAMIIIGGMGSLAGAILGAGFVVLFPYAIEAAAGYLPARFGNMVFALDYAAFGVVMILFLLLEPEGLLGLWHRLKNSLAARQSGAKSTTAPQ
jgi:branched-chain amino acid transport system permease protein